MQQLRRFIFPLRLASLRVVRRGGPLALVALGVAAGSAALAAVLATSLAARDQSLARATARIPAAQRAVRATWGGFPGQSEQGWPALDRTARRALAALEGSPLPVMLYRETQIAGDLVDLGAVDGLRRFVRLRSGRLPRPCTPGRCEVLQVAGSGRLPSVPGLRIVRVGWAALTSAIPLGDLISRDSYRSILGAALRYHTPATPPFLLAESVRGLAAAPALDTVYRSYAWVLPIEPAASIPGASAGTRMR